MNKSIKKSLFITIILMNIFFFNTYKVNAKDIMIHNSIGTTKCYYLILDPYVTAGTSYRNPTLSNEDKRLYYSINYNPQEKLSFLGTTYPINIHTWQDTTKGHHDFGYIEGFLRTDAQENWSGAYNNWDGDIGLFSKDTHVRGCYPYLKTTGAVLGDKANIKPGEGNKMISVISNYFQKSYEDNNKLFMTKKISVGHSFTYSDLPTQLSYIPLYYYEDFEVKDGDIINYKVYAGESGIPDTVTPYVETTVKSYYNLSTQLAQNMKKRCKLDSLKDSQKDEIYKKVYKSSDDKSYSPGNDSCNDAIVDLGRMSKAMYYWYMGITNGGQSGKGFKIYKEKIKKYDSSDSLEVKMNDGTKIDTKFMTFVNIPKSEDSAISVLRDYFKIEVAEREETNLCSYSSICNYITSSNGQTDVNNCQNYLNNTCKKSQDYLNCKKNPKNTEKLCDKEILDPCMKGIRSDWDTLKQKWDTNCNNASNNVTNIENSILETKSKIGVPIDNMNPLSMLNGSIDSSVNFECSDISFLRFIWLIMIIAAPILTIVFGVLDFTQAVMAGDEQKMNKLKSKFIKRLAALALFIILPIIIKTIVNISDNDSVRSIKMAKCIVNGEE